MIQQHLTAWFWSRPISDLVRMGKSNPFVVGVNALGGFAAPLFIFLAGVSAELATHAAHAARVARGAGAPGGEATEGGRMLSGADLRMVVSGVFLLAVGYALNLLTPSWFGPFAFYVLHLLGVCQLCMPGLRRLDTWALAAVALTVVLVTPDVQVLLDVPKRMGHDHMGYPEGVREVVEFALAEGHFPVFPWFGLFVAGVASSRLWRLSSASRGYLVAGLTAGLAVVLAATGVLLKQSEWFREAYAAKNFSSAEAFFAASLERTTRFAAYHYPTTPPNVLGFAALALLLATLALRYRAPEGALARRVMEALTAAGQASLTLFVAHIVVFRQGGEMVGAYHVLSAGTSLALAWLVTLLALPIASVWQRSGYRYGLEHLRRAVLARMSR